MLKQCNVNDVVVVKEEQHIAIGSAASTLSTYGVFI